MEIPDKKKEIKLILELQKPLHMHTSKGDGIALFMIDYGAEDDILWVVGINETGEIWCIPNYEVRLMANWSYRRTTPEKPKKRQ